MSYRTPPLVSLLPLVVVGVAIGLGIGWTVVLGFSASSALPLAKFAGLASYRRLLGDVRWWAALRHLLEFAVVFIPLTLAVGTMMAIALDRGIRHGRVWQTVFLYPYAISFVAAGIAWRWLLDPVAGLQSVLRAWGLGGSTEGWLANPETVLIAVAVAMSWQFAGFTMVILLAAMARTDRSLAAAARLDGIPEWRYYSRVLLPQLVPSYLAVSVILGGTSIRLFDAVVAMTNGGPGLASDVPARYVMDYLFNRTNLSLASAAATFLLVLAGFVLGIGWVVKLRATETAV